MTPQRPPRGRSFSDASIAPSSRCRPNSVWLLSCVMCKGSPTTRSLPRCESLRGRCGHASAAAASRCASSWPILPRRPGPSGGHKEERLMTTGHVTELLSAYLDERVGADERARIVAHLDACEACRAHLESLRRTVDLLHTAEPVRAPEGFRAHVRARIEAHPRRAPRTLHLPRWIASRRTRIAEVAGGFIADSSYAAAGSMPEGTFVLRVPAPRFADVLSQVASLGHVQQRRISGQDVTEEYVDLQARIRNLERYEQRLLAFVDRAAKVSDLLAIEQELARVRGEIEMLTGRARHLDRQLDLASIHVSAHEH